MLFFPPHRHFKDFWESIIILLFWGILSRFSLIYAFVLTLGMTEANDRLATAVQKNTLRVFNIA